MGVPRLKPSNPRSPAARPARRGAPLPPPPPRGRGAGAQPAPAPLGGRVVAPAVAGTPAIELELNGLGVDPEARRHAVHQHAHAGAMRLPERGDAEQVRSEEHTS